MANCRSVLVYAAAAFSAGLVSACSAKHIAFENNEIINGTYDFVFSALTIDPNDGSPAAGFNLDGFFSSSGDPAACGVADRQSDLDLDQNLGGCSPGAACQGGVDNQLPGIVSSVDCIELA